MKQKKQVISYSLSKINLQNLTKYGRVNMPHKLNSLHRKNHFGKSAFSINFIFLCKLVCVATNEIAFFVRLI